MTDADIGARFDEMQSQQRPIKRKRKPKAQRIADLPVSKEDRREAILRQMAKLQRELDAVGFRLARRPPGSHGQAPNQ
jgi:hypothetical protein